MLSSRTRYLWWARQRRQHDALLAAEPSIFHAMRAQWKPVVKPKPKPPAPAPAATPRARRGAWSPWLWVKD